MGENAISVRPDYSQIPGLVWEELLELDDILFGTNESRAAVTSSNSPKQTDRKRQTQLPPGKMLHSNHTGLSLPRPLVAYG